MRTHILTLASETNLTNSVNYQSLDVTTANGFSVQFSYTPQPNTDANFIIQASIDNITFADLECSAQRITNTTTPASKIFNVSDIYYPYMRVYVEIITGGFTKLDILFARK